MIQRLLFYRIDAEAGGTAISKVVEGSVNILSDIAETALTGADSAVTGTKRATNLIFLISMPPPGTLISSGDGFSHGLPNCFIL
jgi:hypothetical protein